MASPNNIEGGFGGYNDRIDTESRQISKSILNLSKEEYVSEVMQAARLSGEKYKTRLGQYFDENEDLINPQQKGLRKSQLTTIVKKISNKQKSNESNAGISEEDYDDTQVSSEDEVLHSILDKNIGNSINPEVQKNVPTTDEVDTIITTETPELSPEQQARVDKYQYPTRPANKNDYDRGYNLPEWLNIEVDSEEHNKLKEAIKELGVMPKLGELDTIIKAQHQSNEISGNYLSFINATRELYGLNPLQTTAEVEELLESLPDDRGVEPIPVESEAQSKYYIVEGSRFNLSRYNGNDEMRLAKIKDDLSELGISEIELDELISSRGFPDIPSKSIKIGDKIVDWDDEDPESRLSYRESAIAEYYGIDTNKGMFTDDTQATEDENIREKITYGNMSNKAWKNLNTGETLQTFGRLPDTNTEEESIIEGRAKRRSSSADVGDMSPDAEAEPTTSEPEVLVSEDSGPQSSTEPNPDSIASFPEDSQQPPEAEVTESTNPDLDELQSELSRLVAEAANKLNIEQEQENNQEYSSRLDREKIDIFTENAKQAIQDYQKFASEHSAPFYNSNAEIQKRYLELERTAWDALYKLAHYLDGEIATLPQDRDIQLSHPEGVDTRQYLEERGYKFDENGYITDITDNGIEIELNRPVRIESLIKSKRPSRVLYPNPFKSSAISNDIQDGFGTNINIIKDKEQIPSRDWNRPITNNVDLDRYSNRDRPSYYNSYLTKGYLINGLNKNTPDFLLGVLDKEHLKTVIVDETKQVNNSSKVIKDPWIEESKGETEFEQIFADRLKDNNEISGNVGTPDPWSERTEQPEVETTDGSNITLNTESTSPNLDKDAIIKEYRQIGFSEEQLAFIKQAIDLGDTPEQIALYAKPEYEVAQIIVEREKKLNPNLDISQYEGLPYWQQTWIITGILAGHTPEQIALYAKSGINSNEIEEIKSDIRNGLTIEQINEKKIKKRAEGYLNSDWGFSRDKLIRQLESEGLTNEQVTQAIDGMDINWDLEAIKRARSYLQNRPETRENWSKNELIEQLEFEQFTDEQAIFAVDNISEYHWKEDDEVVNPEQSEIRETTPQVSLEDLRLAYARAEETWNRKRGDEYLEDAFIEARDAYNTELEKVLKLQVAQGQEANIHELFKNEVISLREQRITQSKELQGTWEKRFNNTKEKLLGWATKNKTRWMLANIGLLATGGLLSLTGVGIPVAGALEGTRRALGSVMSGVSANNTLVGLMEDRDTNINIFGKNIKFQAVIPKLVKESLSTNEDDFKKVSDDVLKDRLGTLEAYYRLNGGKFTNDDQQKAYEKILIELGHRVRVNTLENYQNTQESSSEQTQDISANQDGLQESVDTSSQDNNSTEVVNSSNTETFNFGESRYTSELLNIISDKRVQELDKFRRNRKIAAVAGVATTGILGSLLVNDMHRPGSMFNPNDTSDTGASVPKTEPGSGTGGANTGESVTPKPTTEPISPNPSETPGTRGLGEPPSAPEAQPTGAGEALSQSEQLSQDVSNLTPRESIWTEVAKQLKGATDAQIQQAVENLLQSAEGQNSIYKLAQGTEGGRALLSQWGIDNASEMAILSKEQLYEIYRYLAPGELQGITELSLDNLTPFEAAEPPQVDVSESMDTTTSTTEAPIPSVEPTPSAAPEATAPTEPTAFIQELSEILGKSNLTEIQARDMIQNYFLDDYGREAIYKSLAKTPEGAQFLSQGFGVNSSLDFASLTPEQMYEISQNINPADLEKIINESIFSKFEMADVVSLVEGDSLLGAVNRYIASEVGNLPYDSTLGQQVLNVYINTPEGKEWLYESIVSNPNPNNQNVQMFREYLRFEGIQSVEDFKHKFDWVKFSGNRRIPTSGFWNYTRLPNGNMRIAPLSTFLQPGKMVGIPEAIRQVLIKQ